MGAVIELVERVLVILDFQAKTAVPSVPISRIVVNVFQKVLVDGVSPVKRVPL
jgi:hypothetical protein